MGFKNDKNIPYGDITHDNNCSGMQDYLERKIKKLSGMKTMSLIPIRVMVIWACTFINVHQTVCLIFVHYIICKLYLGHCPQTKSQENERKLHCV